jgi:hypothetical protein
MQVDFAAGGEVREGVELFKNQQGQWFVEIPPGGYLLVEPCCLNDPFACRWEGDRVFLVCCEPYKKEGTGEIRFRPSKSRLPRLILAKFDRRLITFPQCGEPPSYSIAAGANYYTQGHYLEASHNNVAFSNNGHALADQEYSVFTTMLPGDHVIVTINVRETVSDRVIMQAAGDVLVCKPDGSVSMHKIAARRW